MSTKVYQVAIAGCGIAGLASALFLKRAGHEPIIFDQMEAPAPVGSGLMLQPTGLAVLKELGLQSAAAAYGQPIDRLLGLAGTRPILDVRYNALKSGYRGLAIHRAALFHVLYKAAQTAEIEIRPGHTVTGRNGTCLSFEKQASSENFDFIINALGSTSVLRPGDMKTLPYAALWTTLDWSEADGFDPHMLEQRYKSARKMVGFLPVGTMPGDTRTKTTLFWSLKHTDYAAWQAGGLEKWKAEVLGLWPETAPLLAQITKAEQLTLARYAHQTQNPPYDDGLVHIGDAYHAASPQLGQGANMALLDAYALATAIDTQADPQAAFRAFHKSRKHHVWLYQLMAFLFTPVYQSDGRIIPWLRDYLVPPIARIPPFPKLLAAIVAGIIGRPLQALGLTRKD